MPDVNIELNFFYMHYNDAKKFAEWASEEREGDVYPSIYVRHAVISTVFASEALINRVLAEFSGDADVAKILERESILDKWYLAPFLCSGGQEPTPFEKGKAPYQSFKELIQIRNWFAHPKFETFLKGTLDPKSTIGEINSDEEYPWLEMLKGENWPQTRLPKNPFELTHLHASAAIEILDEMIHELSKRLDGKIDERWRNLITVKDANGVHHYRAPVFSIWGGYGGRNS